MHLRLTLVLTACLLSWASPASAAGRPRVAVDFELDDALFKEFGGKCRTKVEEAVEACARTQGVPKCSVGPVDDDSAPASWWSRIPFVDFRGGSNEVTWKLVLDCADPEVESDCPMAIHASLDGGETWSFAIFDRSQYSYVLDGCVKQDCQCDQFLSRIFKDLPKVLAEKSDQLANLFGRELEIATVALPDPANQSWVLPVSRQELQTGLFTVYLIRHGNTYCRAQDFGAETDLGYPAEWKGKISSEVLVSTKPPLQQLDERCREYLEGLSAESPSPVEGLELRIDCFVHPDEDPFEVFSKNPKERGRCQ